MDKRILPLALAYAGNEGPVDGRTRLQKMVFVIQQELIESGQFNEDQLYEFFAYDYGPFSKELAQAVDDMIDQGLLNEEEVEYNEEGDVKYIYELEPPGQTLIADTTLSDDVVPIIERARQIKERYNDELSLPEVIDEVYAEYPEYTENSVY